MSCLRFFFFFFVNWLFKLIGLHIRKQVQLVSGVSHETIFVRKTPAGLATLRFIMNLLEQGDHQPADSEWDASLVLAVSHISIIKLCQGMSLNCNQVNITPYCAVFFRKNVRSCSWNILRGKWRNHARACACSSLIQSSVWSIAFIQFINYYT